ncbi:MAG: CysS/YqeB C-terminal domain-containing protein, partial [Ilumatobacteraceae bacterium]
PTESPAEDNPADKSLGDTTERCLADFNTAIDSGDADQALRAVLELEEAITAWSADTLQSDDADRARATLRSMITRLGDAAVKGLDDPTLVRAPLVEALLEIRAIARSEKRFDLSDLIRDRLDAAEIDVKDTADGAEWSLRNEG